MGGLLQAPWLQKSYLVGHPAEAFEDYQTALLVYQRVLEFDPHHILGHLLQGKALLNLEREPEAKMAFTTALHLTEQEVRQHPERPRAWVHRGDALWMLAKDTNQYAEVLSAYERALLIAPECVEAYLNRGWMLYALSWLEGALCNFQQVIHLAPDEPYGYYGKGSVFWDMRIFGEAVLAHDQALALDPTFMRAYIAKATALSYLGREAEALEVHRWWQRLKDTYNADRMWPLLVGESS